MVSNQEFSPSDIYLVSPSDERSLESKDHDALALEGGQSSSKKKHLS